MSTIAAEPPPPQPADADIQAVQNLKSSCARIKNELAKVIVGQEAVVEEVLIAILTRSHALLVGNNQNTTGSGPGTYTLIFQSSVSAQGNGFIQKPLIS